TVAKTGFKHPIQSPPGFLNQALAKFGVGVHGMQSFRKAEQAVDDFAGIAHTLRQIARIVPPAINDNASVSVDRDPIPMANTMHSGNCHAAPLPIKKIERLENRLSPNSGSDRKRARTRVTCLQSVETGLMDLGKIHYLVLSHVRPFALNRFGEHGLSAGFINQ